jgi:hypothetical protein
MQNAAKISYINFRRATFVLTKRLRASTHYCKSTTTFFSANLVLKRAVERRRIVFKRHHIDEPPALGFSFNFTVGLGFDLKKGWEMGFRENSGWENDLDPPFQTPLDSIYPLFLTHTVACR